VTNSSNLLKRSGKEIALLSAFENSDEGRRDAGADPTLKILRGDAPLEAMADDEFGLKKVVDGLSTTLGKRIRADGYALGVEGPWGSGKSTLANFIAEKLEEIEGHHIIRFEPWLIGEKNALLASFFGQLALQIDGIDRDELSWWHVDRWRSARLQSKLSKKIRRYGEYIGVLATPIGGLAAADPSGVMALSAVGLRGVGLVSRLFGKSLSIEELKLQIILGLRELGVRREGIRITVIIDDTDRLEPGEAVELLRMVRKVADFPFMTYVICFDGNILSQQIENVLQVEDGRLFFEKIFQDIVHIPPQEPFALRRYLKRLLGQSFPIEMRAHPDDHDVQYRKHLIFDRWAGQFVTTPRDVIRLNEAIIFGWPCVPIGSDFFDFIWLQLIKQKSQELYNWTQGYMQNVGAYRDGGRAGDNEPHDKAETLSEILKKFGWSERVYLSGIDKFLPGLKSLALSGEKQKVFAFELGELESFEREKRLGSPSHWRRYFAFDMPSYAIDDDEIAAFRIMTAQGNDAGAATILMTALDKPHERPGHFVDVLLDRLLDVPTNSISENEADGMMLAFAATMDEIAQRTGQIKSDGSSEIWRKTSKLLRANSDNNFSKGVAKGKSINWLAFIVRDQGFAHGLPEGNRDYPESQWLTRAQLDDCIHIIEARFESLGMRRIFALPSPLDVLFCWLQLGDAGVVRQKFSEATDSNIKFISGISALRGWANSSNIGVHHPLHAQIVELFINADETLGRLESMANPPHKGRGYTPPPSVIRERAKVLLAAWVRKHE